MKPLFTGGLYKLIAAISFLIFGHGIMAQKKSQIKFQADHIEYDEKLGNKARRLIDNVIFEHKGTIMHSDSAWHYPEKNSLDAFGKIRITQGDSLVLLCDLLHYDGESEVFTCQNNVILEKKDIRLTTDHLVYSRNEETGYYSDGGHIENKSEKSTLTSLRGYYYTTSGDFYFRKDVKYQHPDFTIEADTLIHNSINRITTFEGPTKIYSGTDEIRCERGFFNSVSGFSKYYQNAVLYSGVRRISGDTIYYDKTTTIGEIRGNADIFDTSEMVSIRGQQAWIRQDKDSAVITIDCELQQYFDVDTLYLHADTFRIYKTADSTRSLYAYRHVRFFKKDLQGKCDSLVYSFTDSAIKMFSKPVLWSSENQITGEYIQVNTAAGRIHSLDVLKNSFIASMVDDSKYNQVRGKDMKGMFEDNKLDRLIVTGNGQTIYYARDEEERFIGVNRGESSSLNVKLVDNEINEIAYINAANATFYPLGELAPQELKLRGFSWLDNIRPKDRSDIFYWPE